MSHPSTVFPLRLLRPAARSTRTAPAPHLLTPASRCDAGAVMRYAHALARADVAHSAAQGRARRYKIALRDALHAAWIYCHAQRDCAARDAEHAAAAALNDRTALLMASMRHDRTMACMIDSLPRHLAAVDAIDACAAALGLSL